MSILTGIYDERVKVTKKVIVSTQSVVSVNKGEALSELRLN